MSFENEFFAAVSAFIIFVGGAEHDRTPGNPLEHPLRWGGEAVDEPSEAPRRGELLELESASEPAAAAQCNTDCNEACKRRDCVDRPWGGEWCGPWYVNPACRVTCEVEKKAACASIVQHCTDKWSQKKSVDDRFDRVVWAELGTDDYLKLSAAVAAAAATAGAASTAVFTAFYNALGDLIVEVAHKVGREAAAKYFYDAMNYGTVVAGNITVGRQVWKREECSPSCDNPWVRCVPLPASNAFYVGWDY